jgi:hypothetical protein
VSRFFAGASGDGSGRSRWTDRILGILVGVVLGLGVLVYFVFVHSEGTIDAPKVKEGKGATTTGGGEAESNLPAHPGSPEEPVEESPGGKQEGTGEPGEGGQSSGGSKPIPVVKVIGGAPPTGSGPKQLRFTKGEKVRFEIESSEPFSFEIKGLGITQTIESTSTISFRATKTGQFPVIATATLIGVADLQISPKK